MRVGWYLVGAALALCGCGSRAGPAPADAAPSVCGNGLQEAGEACDGDDLAGFDCDTLGYAGGMLACSDSCTLEVSLCAPDSTDCGNRAIDPGEECDGDDLGGLDCPSLGYLGGRLHCTIGCQIDSSQCTAPVCGDGTIAGDEECDDGNIVSGDGCSNCLVRPGWRCEGEPSTCCRGVWQGPGCTGPCVVHVDGRPGPIVRDGASWSTPYAGVQVAVDLAAEQGPECEVWVAAGAYYVWDGDPTDTITLHPWTRIYGGFAGHETQRDQRDWVTNQSILDGRNPTSLAERVHHVLSAVSVAGGFDPLWVLTEIVLDGLVVTGGDARGATVDRGGGLHASSPGGVRLKNSVFVDNAAGQGGGAWLGVGFPWNDSIVENCRFEDNTASGAGGGLFHLGGGFSRFWVSDSIFLRNHSDGTAGGLAVAFGSTLDVSTSAFVSNTSAAGAGGAAVDALGVLNDVAVRDTLFVANRGASAGGLMLFGSSFGFQGPRVELVVFAGNEAVGDGGGAATVTGSAEFVDTVFVGNTSEAGSGAVASQGFSGSAALTRCVLAGNSSNGLDSDDGGGVGGEGVSLSDSVLVGNHAVYGGGAAVGWSPLQVQNSTFVGNVADVRGGGLLFSTSPTSVVNSIFWQNSAPDVPQLGWGFANPLPDAAYSIVDGGYPGPTVLDQDPQFVAFPAALATGSWVQVGYDSTSLQTTLEDAGAAWPPGGLAGRFVHPNQADPRWLWIVNNTATELFVWGDMTDRVSVGDSYAVYDLRLTAGSPAVDSADDGVASLLDLLGSSRVDIPGVGTSIADRGAYEYLP